MPLDQIEPPATVVVHLEVRGAPGGVARVEERREGFHVRTTEHPLCPGTCDVALPTGLTLVRFGGPGVVPVEARLRLTEGGGARVRADLRPTWARNLGIGIGATGSAFGVVMRVLQVVQATNEYAGYPDPALDDLLLASSVVTLVGLGVGSAFVAAGSSTVRVETLPPPVSLTLAPTGFGVSGTF